MRGGEGGSQVLPRHGGLPVVGGSTVALLVSRMAQLLEVCAITRAVHCRP